MLEVASSDPLHWQAQLKNAVRTAEDLLRLGFIRPEHLESYRALVKRFPLVITPYYLSLINRTDSQCPIARQAIPSLAENEAGGESDPLNDLANRPASRITHRYANRLLVHLTPNCSMNCRYCFRKSLLGENRPDFFEGSVEAALSYIKNTPQIEEVIFSGGDPFLANEATLGHALEALRPLAFVQRVRFHTRVPATLPMRVDEAFAKILRNSGKPTVVVNHFNHPKELTALAQKALETLKREGHTLLNQSVLLRGVNDSVETLKVLSEKLFEAGVLPYYLHHPDKAQGTAHFDLSLEEGSQIYRELMKVLPGYLLPRYVVDDGSTLHKKSVAG